MPLLTLSQLNISVFGLQSPVLAEARIHHKLLNMEKYET